MDLSVFGTVHILYLLATVPVSVLGLVLAKKYAKSERAQQIVLKSVAAVLCVPICVDVMRKYLAKDEKTS